MTCFLPSASIFKASALICVFFNKMSRCVPKVRSSAFACASLREEYSYSRENS
jgi:hypothetical protein